MGQDLQSHAALDIQLVGQGAPKSLQSQEVLHVTLDEGDPQVVLVYEKVELETALEVLEETLQCCCLLWDLWSCNRLYWGETSAAHLTPVVSLKIPW